MVERKTKRERQDDPDDAVEIAGKGSFPASDPPSWTSLHTGHPDKPKPAKKPAGKAAPLKR
jgi:hypothetical protein